MKHLFPFYIGFLYLFALIIYPQWYLPGSPEYLRYLLATFFLLLTLGGFLLARYLANESWGIGPGKGKRIWKDHKYEFIVGIFCLITHLPFMKLPILTLGDCHMHAGLPSLALAELNSLCIEKIGISFRAIFLLCLGIFLVLVLLHPVIKRRRSSLSFDEIDKFHNGVHWNKCLARFLTFPKGFSLVVLSGVIYIVLLNQFPILERFGNLEHFFRYPVLGKFLSFIGYTIFGIHEWVGRAIQIIFLVIGALYFSRLLELLSNRETARAGYLIYLMFPPFWDLAHQNYLTAGVLFFSVATIYYLARYLQQGKQYDIYIAMAIMATGITYKRFIIALIPITYAMAIACSFFRRKLSTKSHRVKELKGLFLSSLFPLGLAIPNLLLFSRLSRFYRYYPQGSSLQHFLSPDRLVENLRLIPSATGWPLVFVAIAGLFLALKYSRILLIYFLLWFLGYWFLISASDGYCFIRHSLIGYIPIAGFIAFCAGMVWRKLSRRVPLIPCILYLYLSFLCLYVGQGEAVSLERRNEVFLPYDKLFQFIKDEKLYNCRIYAPMKCEPSHFYMAKYGLVNTDFLFRKKWDEAVYGEFNGFLLGEKFHYLVIPQGPRVKGIVEEYIDETLLSEILNGRAKYMRLCRIFQYGENTLLLFQILSTDINNATE